MLSWRIVATTLGLIPALLLGVVFAKAGGIAALGIVVAIWFSGFFCGYGFAGIDVIDPLFAQTRDAIDQTKHALAGRALAELQRDEALRRLRELEVELEQQLS